MFKDNEIEYDLRNFVAQLLIYLNSYKKPQDLTVDQINSFTLFSRIPKNKQSEFFNFLFSIVDLSETNKAGQT